MPSRFEIGERDFLLDGQPFRILAGALHYFRVHPDQWADRIRKARLMGLNTIETYVAWNAHAPSGPALDFGGGLDLGRFLDLVAAEGMQAIVRPGPYICAEWDNGGLPVWLYRHDNVGIRADEPQFLRAVADYLEQLAAVVAPRQVDRGGPVILVQIENEYGAYGSDPVYLRKLVEINRAVGFTVPFITVDQPAGTMLRDGSLPELHKTGSFGGHVAERLAVLRSHQPTGPLMCAEFWDGWFDDWGGHHHTTSAAQAAADLDLLLQAGASVNVYMFHGGTNFGFTNGANHKGTYRPILTSYDYDAPLDETGHPTEKYWAFREVIGRYAKVPDEVPDEVAAPSPAFPVTADRTLPLGEVVSDLAWRDFAGLPAAEQVGSPRGFTLYRAAIPAGERRVLSFGEVRDRAQVLVDGVCVADLQRDANERTCVLPDGASRVEILVEDMGRVNYGPRIGEAKGLIGPALVDGRRLDRWEAASLPLDDVEPLAARLRESAVTGGGPVAGPAFALARFDAPTGSDLHLRLDGWGRGAVWLNGFPLGRYWSRGPQATLYVPAPVVRAEGNELVVFETRASSTPVIRFVERADLGPTEV